LPGEIAACSVACPGSPGALAALATPITVGAAAIVALGYVTSQINLRQHRKDLEDQGLRLRELDNEIVGLKQEASLLEAGLAATAPLSTAGENALSLKQDVEPQSAIKTGKYTVQSGDYLEKIAAELPGVSVDQIIAANAQRFAGRDPSLIYSGEVLNIPTSSDITQDLTWLQRSEDYLEMIVPAHMSELASDQTTNLIYESPAHVLQSLDRSLRPLEEGQASLYSQSDYPPPPLFPLPSQATSRIEASYVDILNVSKADLHRESDAVRVDNSEAIRRAEELLHLQDLAKLSFKERSAKLKRFLESSEFDYASSIVELLSTTPDNQARFIVQFIKGQKLGKQLALRLNEHPSPAQAYLTFSNLWLRSRTQKETLKYYRDAQSYRRRYDDMHEANDQISTWENDKKPWRSIAVSDDLPADFFVINSKAALAQAFMAPHYIHKTAFKENFFSNSVYIASEAPDHKGKIHRKALANMDLFAPAHLYIEQIGLDGFKMQSGQVVVVPALFLHGLDRAEWRKSVDFAIDAVLFAALFFVPGGWIAKGAQNAIRLARIEKVIEGARLIVNHSELKGELEKHPAGQAFLDALEVSSMLVSLYDLKDLTFDSYRHLRDLRATKKLLQDPGGPLELPAPQQSIGAKLFDAVDGTQIDDAFGLSKPQGLHAQIDALETITPDELGSIMPQNIEKTRRAKVEVPLSGSRVEELLEKLGKATANRTKGDLAEEIAKVVMEDKNYTLFDGSFAGGKGFDAVLIKGPLNNPEEIIIIESKYSSKGYDKVVFNRAATTKTQQMGVLEDIGTSNYQPAAGRVKGTNSGYRPYQGSPEWIDHVSDNLWSKAMKTGDWQLKLFTEILHDHKDKITRLVTGVDVANKSLLIWKLPKAAP